MRKSLLSRSYLSDSEDFFLDSAALIGINRNTVIHHFLVDNQTIEEKYISLVELKLTFFTLATVAKVSGAEMLPKISCFRYSRMVI